MEQAGEDVHGPIYPDAGNDAASDNSTADAVDDRTIKSGACRRRLSP